MVRIRRGKVAFAAQMCGAIALLACDLCSLRAADNVGARPYELDWAGRTSDDHPPLIDFEQLDGWTVKTRDAEARFERSREQQLWGRYVGKLTYRATGNSPLVRILPPKPIVVTSPVDAVTCWIYGNNWAWVRDQETPQVNVRVLLENVKGDECAVSLGHVNWKEWYLLHRRLGPEQIPSPNETLVFKGIEVLGGRNRDDRVLYFDNIAVFREVFPPLSFEPRPARGVEMFPGQGCGTNTGPGKLPFPTRPQTILPENTVGESTSTLRREKGVYTFEYIGKDGRLVYQYKPASGTWSDIVAQWQGRGPSFQPLDGGGVRLVDENGKAVDAESRELLGVDMDGDTVTTNWRLRHGKIVAEVTYLFRLWGKTLVIDTLCRGGLVSEVCYGRAVGLTHVRLVTLPYYDYGGSRPAVVVAGPPTEPLFLCGHTDWYRSNASLVWADNSVNGDTAAYQGGGRYTMLTNGTRNDCYERFFITVSPQFNEVLPTIANPISPWKQVTGKGVWRAHGASNRENDKELWRNVYRYGMRHVIVTDHETGWRDGGESFTFRTRTAPGKGGDEGQRDYARYMQDTLGFVYGPYNNYTDFAPVNEFWNVDLINRGTDNQLQHAWARCYAPKPARAVEYCAALAPKIQEKFNFSTAYCDVHTCVTPWSRTDYDARVPGAGTFAATFYAYGEIMLLQKRAWNGPVYSEGGKHCYYCGLTDGNYAQDQSYGLPQNPWLVDFDLLKLHDLCCNFGMGNLGMFYGRKHELGQTPEALDRSIDRFLAATVAFGHPGFLTFEGGFRYALRSYYMVQQLAARYTQVPVASIRYVDASGGQLDTSTAVANGVVARNQVVCRYRDGTITVANGHESEFLQTRVDGRNIELPPTGYAAWTADRQVHVFSGLLSGRRCDYADTPDYIYIDGRGHEVRFPRAAGSGQAICRVTDNGWELIPYQGADCGFAVDASTAFALDSDGKEIGRAELRRSRGLVYVMPVDGAFSYRLEQHVVPKKAPELTCSRAILVPGETVTIHGPKPHRFTAPAVAVPGKRIWHEVEGQWIDFMVVPVAEVTAALEENTLQVDIRCNLGETTAAVLRVAGGEQKLDLPPEIPRRATFNLGLPDREEAEVLTLDATLGGFAFHKQWGMEVRKRHVDFDLPDSFEAGMNANEEGETFAFGNTGAQAIRRSEMACGEVTRNGIFMHPPYRGGLSGYTFVTFGPVTLPVAPPLALRANVGKLNGSDLGDGIDYRVCVVEPNGRTSVIAKRKVTTHKWEPIEADLSAWAGRSVRLKVIADDGPAGNTSGDWAAWADIRLQSNQQLLVRHLVADATPYLREPGPVPIPKVPLETLHKARRGWLLYEGKGLSGTGTHATFARLNGVRLGNMTAAAGNEVEGVFSKPVRVPLTTESIRALRQWNTLEIDNPHQDCFSVRRFWLELELADGRHCTSDVTTATFSQPGTWAYAEGIGVSPSGTLTVGIWFP